MLTQALEYGIRAAKAEGLYRKRQVIANGMLNFSANDYLSLSQHPRIQKAYQRAFSRYATGSGGSMMVCGYHTLHRRLERAFAEALGVEACALFSSGYAANLSVMALLAHWDGYAVLDKAVHASIYDGLRASSMPYARFQHNQLSDLQAKLLDAPAKTVVVTEGIFSMSGQRAPLLEIAQLTRAHESDLIVDEAHAFGVIGPEGLGAVRQFQLDAEVVPLRTISFGKACAASGAVVAGQGVWIEALLQTARAYIYSTGFSPALAYGLLETLDVLRQADERRKKLQALIAYFRACVARSEYRWRDSDTPIQQLQLGCPKKALEYSRRLQARAIVALPMRQPTVSKSETGLRIILNYHHEPEDIDRLFA